MRCCFCCCCSIHGIRELKFYVLHIKCCPVVRALIITNNKYRLDGVQPKNDYRNTIYLICLTCICKKRKKRLTERNSVNTSTKLMCNSILNCFVRPIRYLFNCILVAQLLSKLLCGCSVFLFQSIDLTQHETHKCFLLLLFFTIYFDNSFIFIVMIYNVIYSDLNDFSDAITIPSH